MAVSLSALRTGRTLLPGYIIFLLLVLILCYRLSKPQGLVRLERISKLKKFFHLTGSRTCDLSACSIAPQPLRYRIKDAEIDAISIIHVFPISFVVFEKFKQMEVLWYVTS
jgi:hypothetical protein